MAIQKFHPQFEEGSLYHQRKPYSLILNYPVQDMEDLELIGLWTYFQTLPEGWIISPVHVHKKFGVGKDKVHKFFVQLIALNLLRKDVARNENGTYKSITYTILNGEEYRSKNVMCAPFTENPEPVEPEPVNQPHINTNKNINTNIIRNSKSASDDAHDNKMTDKKIKNDLFNEFWKNYPIKKNKERSKHIWDKKITPENAQLILADIQKRRSEDNQWKNGFIPHPSTYLQNSRWLDDLSGYTKTALKLRSFNLDKNQRVSDGLKGVSDTYVPITCEKASVEVYNQSRKEIALKLGKRILPNEKNSDGISGM
jgi:hypothetical protein